MDLRHSRPFRLTLLLFVALLALAGVVPYFVQADFAQSALVAQLQRDSHRTLTASRTRVVLLPRPALLLQDVSLSDPDKPAIFAQAQQMRIQLSIWPLLSHGRFEVHRVEFKKPVVNIEHRPDGSYNFDDLLAQPDQVGNGLRFNLDRVIFKGADLRYRDNGLNESFRVAGLDLYMDNLGDPKTGSLYLQGELQIGPQQAPQWRGKITANAAMRYHAQERRLLVADLKTSITQRGDSAPALKLADVSVTGVGNLVYGWQPLRLTGGDLHLSASGKRAEQNWNTSLDLPEIKIVGDVLSLNRLALQVDMHSPGNKLSARMQVPTLSGQQGGLLRANAARIDFNMSSPGQKIAANFASPLEIQDGTLYRLPDYILNGSYSNSALPRGDIKLESRGHAMLDLRSETMSMSSQGQLDREPMSAALTVNDFVTPEYHFNIDVNKLDLTPYLPAVTDGAKQIDQGRDLDMAWLERARAQGQVRINELVLKNLHIDDLSMNFAAHDGKLTLDPLAATIYEGRLQGRMEVDASAPEPQIRIQQRLSDTNINTLLTDVLDTSRFEGRGQVDLDIAAQGSSLADLRRTATGNAHLQLKQGAIRGIDVEALLRNTSKQLALLGTEVTQPADQDAKTRFTQLQASLELKDGVARNDDLAVATGVVKLTGAGDIDLGIGVIDYQMKAVTNSHVPELAGLAGLSLPISLSGGLASPEYHVDYSALKNQWLARQKAAEEKAAAEHAAQLKAQAAADAARRKSSGKPTPTPSPAPTARKH
ncbi:hypothetical protein JCM19000A_37710 [Silvimonas sp. JCM 19000]